MLLNAFLASLAGKIAMATGLTVASVSAAGAAGVLPEPAKQAVGSVVEATTPFSLPDQVKSPLKGAVEDLPTNTTLPTGEIGGDDESGDDEGDGTEATRKPNHGACVSTVAKNTSGPGKGKTVSSVARSDCGKTTTSTSVVPTSSTSSTTSTTVVGGEPTSSNVAGERSGNSGPGRANNGRGNGAKSANNGPGNSGKN